MATIHQGRVGDERAGTPVAEGDAPTTTQDGRDPDAEIAAERGDREVAPGVGGDEVGQGMSIGDGTLGGLTVGGSVNPPAGGVVSDTAPSDAAIPVDEEGIDSPTDGGRS